MSTETTTVLSRRMSRRSAVRALAGAGAAMVAVASIGIAGAEHTAQKYTVNVNANFRTGPSTSHSIISVIRKGATFTINGQTQNGFASITYQGRQGWVYASYIVAAGSSGDPVIVSRMITLASVNMRSGPSTGHQILRVVPARTMVDVSDTVQNGFRWVVYGGQAGWIHDSFLEYDQGGHYGTTTTRVNLRAEASTSSKVLTVIPAGAKVQLLHTQANSFLNVNYNGMQGWVHKDYVKL